MGENNNNEIGTAFFIGAGAEIPYGISGGIEFARFILGLKYYPNSSKRKGKNKNKNKSKIDDSPNQVNEKHKSTDSQIDYVNSANEKFYTDLINNKNDWYTKYNTSNINLRNVLEASIKKEKIHALDEGSAFRTQKDFKIYTKTKAKILEKKSPDGIDEFLEKNISYMGVIDKYFHSIINPSYLGPYNFWKTVNLFTRAYLLIITQILNDKKQEDAQFLDILNNPKKTLDNLNSKVECLIAEKPSYYKEIKEAIKQDKHISGIITTNYTPFCSLVGLDDELVAYVHGRLGMFESARELKVYSLDEVDTVDDIIKNKNDILFPYLSVQSGVKPIVSQYQIEEYSKMLNILSNSNQLIILGYNFNIDDNHLNSIIKEWLSKNKNNILIFIQFHHCNKDSIKDTEDTSTAQIKRNLYIHDDFFDKQIKIENIYNDSTTPLTNILKRNYHN